MKENIDISPIHQYLTTKNEVNRFLILFGKVNRELFKQSFNLDEFLTNEASFELNRDIKNLLKVNKIDAADRSAIQIFFGQIQKQVSSLPVIHLILAFPPKEELVKVIHDWFFQNFKKTVLLDISIDATLIGGGVISFNGRANDYSLKNKIDQIV